MHPPPPSSDPGADLLSEEEMRALIEGRPLPGAAELLSELERRVAERGDAIATRFVTVSYGTPAGRRDYDLLRIESSPLSFARPVLLVRAGVHGDEVAGPLTFRDHIDEILDYAHSRGVGMLIYPLDNPSGFDARLRYNAENDRGSGGDGNNDFMRYELPDGSVTGDLLEGKAFARWFWSSDPDLAPKLGRELRLPKETLAMHAELKRLPFDRISAVLDLHQDNFLCAASSGLMASGAYHYAFGDLSRYHHIALRIGEVAPLIASAHIGSGFFGSASAVTADAATETLPKSDSHGFIVRHDGTLPDLALRHGVPHAITVETTGATPPQSADRVNMIWIEGIIDMIAALP